MRTVIAPLFYKWVRISKQAFEIIKIESKELSDDNEPEEDFDSSSESKGGEQDGEQAEEEEKETKEEVEQNGEDVDMQKERIVINMVELLQSVFWAHFRCLEYRTNPELNKEYTNPKEVSMSEMLPKEP